MEILYQIPGSLREGPLGAAELTRRRQRLQEWAGSGSRVEVADAPGGPASIESCAEEALCVAPMLAALQGRTSEPDAVIIGCYSDPGLSAARELLDCPVVGPLESSFAAALQLGDRFGIVTVLSSVVPMLERTVRGMGLADRYAGSLAVDIAVLDLARDPEALAVRMRRQAEELIEDLGADVLAPGCMSMAFLGVAEALGRDLGVPVINPARCALKTAELLASMELTSSRRSFPSPPKSVTA